MATKPLRLVETDAEIGINVTDLLRAEIKARDWSRVHIEGDRASPLFLGERVRRPWRA